MADRHEQQIEAFAAVTNEYCSWAEATPGDAISEAHRARRLLIRLLDRVLDLPRDFSAGDAPAISEGEFRRIYGRFGAMPFNFYSVCFDPLQVPSEEPVVADLADDLADIWRDLKGGLALWEDQLPFAAAWHWRFHFEIHWGHHAAGALYALQTWFPQNLDSEE